MMQLTMNIVWIAPTEHIVCAYYDESRKINRIFNWGKLDDAEPLEVRSFLVLKDTFYAKLFHLFFLHLDQAKRRTLH